MADPSLHDVAATLLVRYPDTVAVETWGETALFCNPGRRLPKGVYLATLKDHDGENDKASGLDRPGVFRLSIGVPRPHYVARFGPTPARPAKGGVIAGPWDFLTIDRVTPHPVYGWMGWIAVLNPSHRTLEDVFPLIDAAFEKARQSLRKRLSARRQATSRQANPRHPSRKVQRAPHP